MKYLQKAVELLRGQQTGNITKDRYLDNAIQLIINEITCRKEELKNNGQ